MQYHGQKIDWKGVERVLVVRLRSIGDTVLVTPSLIALRRFLPVAEIDILLENWVAPVLDGHDSVNRVISIPNEPVARLKVARQLRHRKYDLVFNLHGGTTSTFFTRATGARYLIGYSHYQYSFLYNRLYSSASDFWHTETTHSAEQHLALLGFAGVPVADKPKSRLVVTDESARALSEKFKHANPSGLDAFGSFAMLHPAAAFATKQWETASFARTAEYLAERGIKTVAVAAGHEREILKKLVSESVVPIITFDDLTLPEITALASKAALFVGNDSGVAHMAAAVGTPSVVVFGSSNRNHWRPWTDAPNEIVFEALPCQPCPGYVCAEFGEPKCILSVRPEPVFGAIDKLL